MAILVVLVSIAQVSTAQVRSNELIPRREIFGNPDRASPLISPDGRRIAFLAPLNGVMNIHVAERGKLSGAKAVTNERVRPVRSFSWAFNNTHILYKQDESGNENYNLFAVDPAHGKTVNLTPFRSARAALIAASPAIPDDILVGLNDRDPKWHDVWRINIISGKRTLVERNEGFAEYLADKTLVLRTALKATPDGGFQTYGRAGQAWKPLFHIPPEDSLNTMLVAITGDGKSLLMQDSRGRNTTALVVRDLATGNENVLAEAAQSDISSVILDPQSRSILAYFSEYDQPRWTALSPETAPDIAYLSKLLPGAWMVLSQSADNRLWTLRIDNSDAPVSFALYDRKTKTLERLFTSRPALETAPLVPMASHRIKARDGLELVSYLTLPKGSDVDMDGRPDRPLPLVLNVHGGPWARDRYGYNPEHQWLANRGYAVLSVNYRGSTGFGKAFVNAADGQWGARMHDDLIDAVNWAVASKIAQKDKVAIYGGSFGGYAALVGLAFTPKDFACGVSIVGPSNLNTLLASIPPYWTAFLDNFRKRVADPRTSEGRALLRERSPLFRADKIERPLLIAQGANDPRVKQAEADQIVQAMTAKNIPVTYLLYADEGHGFARPENRLSFYAAAEAFLGQCLGGQKEPIGNDFRGASIAVPTGKEAVPGLGEALVRTGRP